MGLSRKEYWSGLPFPSPVDHILSNLSTMTHPSWVAPRAWLSFIELDKAVVLVWLDWLVFSKYGFSVFALVCPLATPTILLGFLLPWAWGISSRLVQQSAAIAPYLGRAVSPHRRPSLPSMWDSSSRPSCARPRSPWLLGRGVAPPRRRPWPRAWGMGYLLPAAAPDLGRGVTPLVATPGLGPGLLLPAAAPDLGHGVAPLDRSCTVAVWYSRPLPLTWTWGNSSWPPPFRHGVLPASAPDLGCGVAPLGRAMARLAQPPAPIE